HSALQKSRRGYPAASGNPAPDPRLARWRIAFGRDRNRWSDSIGIRGQKRSESLVSFGRNSRSVSVGIRGQFQSEWRIRNNRKSRSAWSGIRTIPNEMKISVAVQEITEEKTRESV